MIKKAESLATEYHKGMTDKYDNPYMEHLERVAGRVRDMEYDFVDETSEIELYVTAAYLHDIIEDTDIKVEDLVAMFSEEVIAAIFRLTREKGTTYAEYIEAVKKSGNSWAIAVKIADLKTNLNGAPASLAPRYTKALESLSNCWVNTFCLGGI